MLDKTLKVLGIAWSLVAFIVGAAFFFGGEWQQWKDVKFYVTKLKEKRALESIDQVPKAPGRSLDTTNFVQFGQTIRLKTTKGYLFGQGGGVAEKHVILSTDPSDIYAQWELQKGD